MMIIVLIPRAAKERHFSPQGQRMRSSKGMIGGYSIIVGIVADVTSEA